MKALSIRQPWAWLITNGIKPVENRTWSTSFRGELLVHAGLQFDKDGARWVLDNFPNVELPAQFDLGGIVGTATLTDCVTSHGSRWFFGPYGLVMAQARPVPFTRYRGQLGWFDVADDLAARLLAPQASQAEVETAGQERLF